MVKKLSLPNNKKILQQQIIKLSNEIEELQLEREESKKNVIHFMQEADSTRQELRKAQELIDELSTTATQTGYQTPPPMVEDEQKPKTSYLLHKLSSLSDIQRDQLFLLLEEPHLWEDLQRTLAETQYELERQRTEGLALQDEFDQLTAEFTATHAALQVENERAEIIERRWKESESHLEQAEFTIQSLNSDLDYLRQQEWAAMTTTPDNTLTDKLCHLEQQQMELIEKLVMAQSTLEEKDRLIMTWHDKCNELATTITHMENKQIEIDTLKMKETHLRTINKTLREEIRKLRRVEQDIVNLEYLRNVIIKFLEKRSTRSQLVPILSTLLQCSNDDQARLCKLSRSNNSRLIL